MKRNNNIENKKSITPYNEKLKYNEDYKNQDSGYKKNSLYSNPQETKKDIEQNNKEHATKELNQVTLKQDTKKTSVYDIKSDNKKNNVQSAIKPEPKIHTLNGEMQINGDVVIIDKTISNGEMMLDGNANLQEKSTTKNNPTIEGIDNKQKGNEIQNNVLKSTSTLISKAGKYFYSKILKWENSFLGNPKEDEITKLIKDIQTKKENVRKRVLDNNNKIRSSISSNKNSMNLTLKVMNDEAISLLENGSRLNKEYYDLKAHKGTDDISFTRKEDNRRSAKSEHCESRN